MLSLANIGVSRFGRGGSFPKLSSISSRAFNRVNCEQRAFSSRRVGPHQTASGDRGRPEVHKNAKKRPHTANQPEGTAFRNTRSSATGRGTPRENSTPATSTSGQAISWYPGHIAKAERELSEYLKKVDVVIEVRDARIPLSTTHPLVPTWVGRKPLLVAVTRLDQVSPLTLAAWKKFYDHSDVKPRMDEKSDMKVSMDRADSSAGARQREENGERIMDTDNQSPTQTQTPVKVFFIDGKSGLGVAELKAHALHLSAKVNSKRKRMGIQPRAIRAAVIGYPNVGKSALINRLIGRRKAVSKNMPGVTRSMQWIRIGNRDRDERAEEGSENLLELLDSPGIIPAKQVDQDVAVKLAICNDIGEASYDKILIAEAMCDAMIALFQQAPQFVPMATMEERYGLPVRAMSGDTILPAVADKFFQGSISSAAERLLSDFRKGHLGQCALEAPPPLIGVNAAKILAAPANAILGRRERESGSGINESHVADEERMEAGGARESDAEYVNVAVKVPVPEGLRPEHLAGPGTKKGRQPAFSFPAVIRGKFDGW